MEVCAPSRSQHHNVLGSGRAQRLSGLHRNSAGCSLRLLQPKGSVLLVWTLSDVGRGQAVPRRPPPLGSGRAHTDSWFWDPPGRARLAPPTRALGTCTWRLGRLRAGSRRVASEVAQSWERLPGARGRGHSRLFALLECVWGAAGRVEEQDVFRWLWFLPALGLRPGAA